MRATNQGTSSSTHRPDLQQLSGSWLRQRLRCRTSSIFEVRLSYAQKNTFTLGKLMTPSSDYRTGLVRTRRFGRSPGVGHVNWS